MTEIRRLKVRFKVWNKWRKYNSNSRLYHVLVLFGIIESPTFKFDLDILGWKGIKIDE